MGGPSFRGGTEGGEPGIHSPRPVVMDSGLAAFAALRNDTAYDSRFKIAKLDLMNIGANGALPFEADDGDPADEITRIESRLDELADAMARCRKVKLISQIAIAAGGIWLLAVAIGIIGFDPVGLMAAIAGVI